MDGCERILKFDIFKCGDVVEAFSSDGFLYRFDSSADGNVSYYICEKEPQCPAKVLVCHDARGFLLNPHVGHEADVLEPELIDLVEPEVKSEPAKLYPDLQVEIEEARKTDEKEENSEPSPSPEQKKRENEGICVLKISLPRDSPFRKTRKFDLDRPPTLEEMLRDVFDEYSSRFDDDPIVRAVVLDWFPNQDEDEVIAVDVSQRVSQWSRYEFLFFSDNRSVEKSLIMKGSAQNASASLTLLVEGCDSVVEKTVDFDMNSPVNLYEALQCCFNEHFRNSDLVSSDVVEGLIFKCSPDGTFAEIDDETEYFEEQGKYKFVYYNNNAPPTAYIVYERIRTMDYAIGVPVGAVLDTNNYSKKTTNAFCDDPRPQSTSELRMICPKRCTSQHRDWRCFDCRKLIHFDGNKRFYCKCGGWSAAATSFKCSSHVHSSDFAQFENLASLKNSIKGFASPVPPRRPAPYCGQPSQESSRRRASDRTRNARNGSGSVLQGLSRVASTISREVRNVFR